VSGQFTPLDSAAWCFGELRLLETFVRVPWIYSSGPEEPYTCHQDLTMIDRHYGHLARYGREHAIRLLDELSAEQRPPWTLVDAAWTPSTRYGVRAGNRNGG
jgi:hypothetical protein